jgi:hypothetical protein
LAQIKPREIASPRSYPDNFAFSIALTNFLRIYLRNDVIPPATLPTSEIFFAYLSKLNTSTAIFPAFNIPFRAGKNAHVATPKPTPVPITIALSVHIYPQV